MQRLHGLQSDLFALLTLRGDRFPSLVIARVLLFPGEVDDILHIIYIYCVILVRRPMDIYGCSPLGQERLPDR